MGLKQATGYAGGHDLLTLPYVSINSFPDNGKPFHWRVAAGNVLGISAFSNTWSFTNGPSAIPAKPVLYYPANILTPEITDSTIFFAWDAADRAAEYDLSVFDDNNNVFASATITDGSTGHYFTNFENAMGTYTWKVIAKNSRGPSLPSDIWTFRHDSTMPPAQPVVLYPTDTNVAGTNICFNWSAANYATSYILEVSAIGQQTRISPEITDLYYCFDNFQDDGTSYTWQVTAINSMASTDSASAAFTNWSADACNSVSGGTGFGVLGNTQNLKTCYNYNENMYYLKDVSRAIETREYKSGFPEGIIMKDTDNIWDNYTQGSGGSGVDAHAYTGMVYDYLLGPPFNSNSYDNCGGTMQNHVELDTINGQPCYGQSSDPPQASWVGYQVQYCVRPTSGQPQASGALDEVAHEWAHAFTMFGTHRSAAGCPKTSGVLNPVGQSGALNEAFSDWVGIAVKRKYSSNVPWTIGEAVRTVRDLSNPPLFPSFCNGLNIAQPDHWRDYTICANGLAEAHLRQCQ